VVSEPHLPVSAADEVPFFSRANVPALIVSSHLGCFRANVFECDFVCRISTFMERLTQDVGFFQYGSDSSLRSVSPTSQACSALLPVWFPRSETLFCFVHSSPSLCACLTFAGFPHCRPGFFSFVTSPYVSTVFTSLTLPSLTTCRWFHASAMSILGAIFNTLPVPHLVLFFLLFPPTTSGTRCSLFCFALPYVLAATLFLVFLRRHLLNYLSGCK